mmetsp:Transcript_61067/g.158527  ORF Transcript_61067/g.158527 Transcript_61067/m.158527 type:complete len:214 (-) Transcript_61067:255-896(-)
MPMMATSSMARCLKIRDAPMGRESWPGAILQQPCARAHATSTSTSRQDSPRANTANITKPRRLMLSPVIPHPRSLLMQSVRATSVLTASSRPRYSTIVSRMEGSPRRSVSSVSDMTGSCRPRTRSTPKATASAAETSATPPLPSTRTTAGGEAPSARASARALSSPGSLIAREEMVEPMQNTLNSMKPTSSWASVSRMEVLSSSPLIRYIIKM